MSSTKYDFNNPVWKKISITELEKQYSPSQWSKRYSAEEVIKFHVSYADEESKITRRRVPNRIDVPYQQEERTKLDIFGEDLPGDSYIVVYVHGGYWQELNKDISAYPAGPLYAKRILTVVVGYTLAPKATLSEIVEEIREAIRWTCKFGLNRNSKGVILMGWSAGGHLISEVLSTLKREDETTFKHLRGFITLSGVFDVRPLVSTYVNTPLNLDEKTAWGLSPLRKVDILAKSFSSLKALIVAGENDSPEFQRQSQEYCEVLKMNKIEALYEEVTSVDHFNMVENLAKPNDTLVLRIEDFIRHI